MIKTIFLSGLLFILCHSKATAERGMYVDNFATIIGDTIAENTLLTYAKTNKIETLYLYELHIVNSTYSLMYAATNGVLADFIKKAKTRFNVKFIGASAENAWFFTNIIDAYNNSRSDSLEKIDIYNLEFDYWETSTVGPGGYYCNNYLTPNGLPCTIAGAFDYYLSTLKDMDTLAMNNSHPITTEAFVGWVSPAEADSIGLYLDRIKVHALLTSPGTAFDYTKARLKDFANGNPNIKVSILYSSDTVFMGNWLRDNSMSTAERIFTEDWVDSSASWANNIDLTGFTYSAYSSQSGIILSTNDSIYYTKANDSLVPVENTLTFTNFNNIISIKVFDDLGNFMFKSESKSIDLKILSPGDYVIHVESEKGVKKHNVVKK